MRRRTRQLGAITGERLEYRLPASVFLALTKAKSQAVCFQSAEGLLKFAASKAMIQKQSAAWSAERAERVKLRPGFEEHQARLELEKTRLRKGAGQKAKKADNLSEFVGALDKELRTLRGRDIKGNIPVCLFRATGKVAKFPREVRRAEAIHERFHADVRRAEERLNARLDDPTCNVQARQALAQAGPATMAALRLSRLANWGTPLEELLARTEEIRKSCLKGEKSCAETKARFRKTVLNYSLRTDSSLADNPGVLADAEAEIRARYGSAMGFVTQALRNPTCKVRR